MEDKKELLKYMEQEIAKAMSSFDPEKDYNIREAGNLIAERTEEILNTLEDAGYINPTHKTQVVYNEKDKTMCVNFEVRPITPLEHIITTFNQNEMGMTDEEFQKFYEVAKEVVEIPDYLEEGDKVKMIIVKVDEP